MKGSAGNAAVTKAILVRMPPEMYDRLVALSKKEDRSVTAQVRSLIADRLGGAETKAAA